MPARAEGGTLLRPWPGTSRAGLARYLAQSVRLRVPALHRRGARVASIAVSGVSSRGRVWVLDASATARTPWAGPRRAPVLVPGRPRLTAAGRGRVRVAIPYSVTRSVGSGARVVVLAMPRPLPPTARSASAVVAVRPGRARGTLRFTLPGTPRSLRGRDLWIHADRGATVSPQGREVH